MATSIKDNVNTGSVVRYMLLPQIMPRLNNLFGSGFGQLALLIAMVYRAVNILPANHPIFLRENRHLLGIRNVLAAASAELKFTRSEIDKVIIYFLVLIGLIIMAVQIFGLMAAVMLNPALAMPTTYAEFFATPRYETDVAYRILHMVFGVPELFNPDGVRREFHIALHSLFQLYSIGMLVIAVLITAYMVFAVLVETAQTGVPFGKRYNHVWAPIRFVIALGLLIPVGYGLNSGQWIALYAAKFGSDFATQGWIVFNNVMTEAYLDQVEQRVGRPQAPDLSSLAAFMMTAQACQYAYQSLHAGENPVVINAYLASNSAFTAPGDLPTLDSHSFEQALTYFSNGDILIRFGEHNPDKHPKWLGGIMSYCGDIVIVTNDTTEPGSLSIQEAYYNILRDMWGGGYGLDVFGEGIARTHAESPLIRNEGGGAPVLPPADYKAAVSQALATYAENAITEAVEAQAESESWDKNQEDIANLGWGGAGIWYNKIAQINGSLVTAVRSTPQLRMMPSSMEYLKSKQLQQNTEVAEAYKLYLADGKAVKFNNKQEEEIAKAIVPVHEYWTKEDTRQDGIGNQVRSTNNIVIDVVNLIFGTKGLFDMCASADVHPLAQLSTLGRGLIEASIRNLALAVGASALGVIPVAFVGIASGAAAKLLLSVASITITMGFILFYVIPFMPFLYFFFAVGGWIKGLFEALVGIPLWALAHLRIDGEGMPGEAAISGYYLIFEIFLRPILIVFGLLASVIIFGAMVKVLNEIFHLVVVNLAGHDENSRTLCTQMSGGGAGGGAGGGGGGGDAVAFFRGPIDELFFTILYAIIVYMIGMSCFKLIDLVPNNLLRYMNVSVSTFNDQQADPAEGLVQRLSFGGSRVSSQVIDIGQQGLAAGKQGLAAATQFMAGGQGQGR